MRKQLILLNALIACATFAFLPAFADPRYPDPEANDAMLYRRGYATSLAKNDKSITFFLLIDQSGVGRLVDYEEHGKPRKALLENGVPSDWPYRKPGEGPSSVWTTLSKKKAKELWGDPHFVPSSPGLSIFDAHGSFNTEDNLYHLDLSFGKDDMVFQYRVRGIGICNARWVTLTPDHKEELRD